MAFKINGTTVVTNDRVIVPAGYTTATLPAGAATGAVGYSTDADQLYYKHGVSGWVAITAKLGTSSRPASSAAAIIAAGDSTGDGVYYIQSTSGVIQTYCDMTNGGYMLAAKIGTSLTDNWMYGGSYWSTQSPLNETECQNLNNGHAVNRLFYEYTATAFRMCLGSKNNALSYTATRTAMNLFTSGSTGTSFGRSTWLNWCVNGGTGAAVSGWDNQPNCNHEGFNISGPSYAGRMMISMNNEGDCSSNDSSVGYGCYTNGETSVSQTRNSMAGGSYWTPTVRYPGVGYIFVK